MLCFIDKKKHPPRECNRVLHIWWSVPFSKKDVPNLDLDSDLTTGKILRGKNKSTYSLSKKKSFITCFNWYVSSSSPFYRASASSILSSAKVRVIIKQSYIKKKLQTTGKVLREYEEHRFVPEHKIM